MTTHQALMIGILMGVVIASASLFILPELIIMWLEKQRDKQGENHDQHD